MGVIGATPLILDYCADAKIIIVGFVANYFLDGLSGYHIFIGQFCGRFGTGFGGACAPGSGTVPVPSK